MTRYWGIRTDTEHNTPFIWRELQAGRLRQGWGRRAEEDLEVIATQLAAGVRPDEGQRQTWRGNGRLLPSERDAVHVDDVAVADDTRPLTPLTTAPRMRNTRAS